MIRTAIALAAAAAVVSASPIERDTVFTVPLTHVNTVTNGAHFVKNAQGRLNRFNGNTPSTVGNEFASSGTVTNEDVSYIAAVSIGGKSWSLIVDTGSSNTWCGAQTSCEKTSTGKSTGGSVEVSYGSGQFYGTEYTDKVSFGGLTVNSQSIGAASSASGFSGVDGIVGFGPVDLTEGTVSNANTVPTFMDNLKSQGSISTEVLGVYFKPESGSDTNDANGELTLGGTDSSKYTGSLTYFPKTTSGDSSAYWGINVASITYGSTTLGSSATGAIVDTGTTLILIPSSAYSKFLSSSGGTTDSNSGLSSWTTKPTGTVGIKFGSTTYTLSPSQYLIPTAQYSYYGLSSGKYYGWIGNGGSSGVNTIIGQKFLENYYSAFDTTNSRIGFATRA